MRKIIPATITLCVFLTTANAQTWSLEKCVSYALENNLSIKQTELSVSLAELDREESKFAILPNLNANATQTHTYGRAINPFTNSYVPQDVNSFNTGVNSQVTVFGGFQKINTLKQSAYALEAEKANLEKTKNDIALTVVNYFLNVLYNQDLLKVAEEQLELSRLQVERAEKNAEVGNITTGDVLQVKAQYANDQLNLANAQNQLDIARLNLIQLLDRDPAEEFIVLRPDNIDQLIASSYGYSFNEVYQSAEQNLPDVKLLEYRYKAAQKGLAATRGGMMPRLTLSGGLSSDYADINPSSIRNQLDNNFSQYFSFGLAIPIFNAHSAHVNTKRAKINLMNAEINTRNARLNLSKTVTQAIADLKASEKKYQATINSFRSLSEAFKYDQQKFDVGLLNSVDYNLSKNNLSKAQAELLQAKYELIFRAKVLDFYQGKSLTF